MHPFRKDFENMLMEQGKELPAKLEFLIGSPYEDEQTEALWLIGKSIVDKLKAKDAKWWEENAIK